MSERRVRSIPQRTMSDVLREQGVSIRLGGASLRIGGLGTGIGRPPARTSATQEYHFDMENHVWREPQANREKPRRTPVLPDNKSITWQVDQVEDDDGMGLILQYSGISFMNMPILFKRSRHDYGPDCSVFSAPVGYRKGLAFLILSTFGDIFESQVVPKKKDVNPSFQEEVYLPDLATKYDPTSMTVIQRNGLVIVGYGRR